MTSMAKLTGLFRREFTRLLAAEPWAVDIGARPPMYGTLQVIAVTEPASQKEVSDIVMLHPSDMVALVDQLETHGLVRRERDPADRRRYQLTLTDRGREVLGWYNEVALAAEQIVLAPLDTAERAHLARLTAKAVADMSLD